MLVRETISTLKVLLFVLKAAAVNSFFPISSTCLVVKRVSTIVYNLQLSFHSKKLIFALLKVRKGIYKTISVLMSAIRKISPKNQGLPTLLFIEKDAITISKVLRLEPLIFWAPTLVCWTQRSSFLAKVRLIAFTFLPKSIKV